MNLVKWIFQYWHVLAGFIILGVLVGYVTEEDKYQSEANLMFKLGREHLYQPEFGNRQPIASTRSDMANAINTETHIISSADVLLAAVRKVSATKILADSSLAEGSSADQIEQSAVDLLSEELSVRAVEGTNVLQLSYIHQSPEIARDTLNAIVDSFLTYRKEVYGDSSLKLMQKKLTENQTALQRAEVDLQEFSVEQNIYSYNDQLNSITEQLIVADRDLQNLSATKSELEVQLQLTIERIGTTDTNISLYTDTATNSLYADAKTRIFNLHMERNQLRGKYHDDSERVTQLLSEIDQLEKYIKTQEKFTTLSERKGRNPALDTLVTQKIAIENKLDAIVGRQESQANLINSLRAKRNELNAVRAEFEKKQSAVDVLKERQLVYVDEVDKAELAMDINNNVRSGARILQRASLPTTKSGIAGVARLKLSALVGLLLAVALLMARSVFSSLNLFPESSKGREEESTEYSPSLSEIDNADKNDLKNDSVVSEGDVESVRGITVLGKIGRA